MLHEKLGAKARIVAIDLLPMDPIRGVAFIQGDFREPEGLAAVESGARRTQGRPCRFRPGPQLVGCGGCGPGAGGASRRAGPRICGEWLQPGGDLVVKAFQGSGFAEFQRSIQSQFDKVYVRKPKASRDRSREVYLVAKRLRCAETGSAEGSTMQLKTLAIRRLPATSAGRSTGRDGAERLKYKVRRIGVRAVRGV